MIIRSNSVDFLKIGRTFKKITKRARRSNMKKRIMILLLGLLLSFGHSSASLQIEQEATIPYVTLSEVVIDGIIQAEEYTGSYYESTTGMYLYWEHDGTDLYIGIDSPGTGWIGIGVGPQGAGMDGVNMIVGYVANTGSLLLLDEVGVGWEHLEDTTLGGTDDISAKAGSESASNTIIELIFPLNSGDERDHSFEVGGLYGFFVAYHASADDFVTYHTARSNTIDLFIASSEEPPEPGIKIDTILSLDIPESVVVDQIFTMVASLQDEAWNPIEGATIEFYRITNFGKLNLGQMATNTEGIATLEYHMRMEGTVELEAIFEGSMDFSSSSTSKPLLVQPLVSADDPRLALFGVTTGVSVDRFISVLGLGVIISILGSIALTFTYVGYQILSVYREKESPDDEFSEPLRFEWRR